MNTDEREFFHIDKELLRELKLFPFHLFVFNPKLKKYALFLYANSPLTEDKDRFLDLVMKKKGKIAIDKRQEKTFLRALNLSEKDLEENASFPQNNAKSEEEIEARKAKERIEESSLSNHKLSQELKKADLEQNYTSLIDAAREEIIALSPKISHTVSLARFLAKQILYRDTQTNRIVSLSFFLAKRLDILDDESLGSLVVASFLANLGITQYELAMTKHCLLEYNSEQSKEFHKYTGLAQHLIKRVNLEISDLCLNTLLEHRERASGNGFPEGKTIHQMQPTTLILAAITHAVEFSGGKVTGERHPLGEVLNKIAFKVEMAGLESDFGDKILTSLQGIIPKNEETEGQVTGISQARAVAA